MLLPSQVAEFFDHQYVRKETINVLDFLHRDINQKKIASKSTFVGYDQVCPAMPSHSQTFLNFSKGGFA